MIGIDTNVLVRYIMQDDAQQSPKATEFMEALSVDRPGFVSQVSVLELVWVLGGCYELTRQQIAHALDALLRTKELIVDRGDQVMKALRAFNKGSADLADCLIESICSSAGCERTVTFDVRASKSAGMALILP